MTNTDDTKQAATHTPEPWFLAGLAENETQLWIRTLDYPITSIRFGKTLNTDKANARRICAAVNACKGISTEALERGVVLELREALAAVIEYAELGAEHLDAIADSKNTELNAGNGWIVIERARAALAKARAT
jgi:hypothetical protein